MIELLCNSSAFAFLMSAMQWIFDKDEFLKEEVNALNALNYIFMLLCSIASVFFHSVFFCPLSYRNMYEHC